MCMPADDGYPDLSFTATDLIGVRILLHPYDEDRDFDRIAGMLSDPMVTGPMGIPHPVPFVEELRRAKRERADRPEIGDWTIFLVENDSETFAGEVGIANWDAEFHIVEIFVSILPEVSGKAIGREAVSLLSGHIFKASPIACIRIQALEMNVVSLKLASSLGFRETGRRYVDADPGRGFVGGIAVMMDLRAHEFRPFEMNE